MIDDDVSVLLTAKRIRLLLRFVTHSKAQVTDDDFFRRLEIDLIILQADAIAWGGLSCDRNVRVFDIDVALEVDDAGNVEDHDARTF